MCGVSRCSNRTYPRSALTNFYEITYGFKRGFDYTVAHSPRIVALSGAQRSISDARLAFKGKTLSITARGIERALRATPAGQDSSGDGAFVAANRKRITPLSRACRRCRPATASSSSAPGRRARAGFFSQSCGPNHPRGHRPSGGGSTRCISSRLKRSKNCGRSSANRFILAPSRQRAAWYLASR